MSSYLNLEPPARTVPSLEKEVADCRRQIAQHKERYEKARSHYQAEINKLRSLLREAGHPDFQTTTNVGRDRT